MRPMNRRFRRVVTPSQKAKRTVSELQCDDYVWFVVRRDQVIQAYRHTLFYCVHSENWGIKTECSRLWFTTIYLTNEKKLYNFRFSVDANSFLKTMIVEMSVLRVAALSGNIA
ncbi:uncharacterized protein EV154DRAFT_486279 [Mucor mucedo]|uniref:uncharacterized protein n=1 Tax=Mucor mucedo TaxID=29922 RepID=UPI00221F5840|nr:uncharacterized protein EV154DRAFT_486279 [Mucor mucedo]KAI7877889.1 hypothetical protein EV154DRAFT_486279 [Mucor mucedo]